MLKKSLALLFLIFQFSQVSGQVLFTFQEPEFGYCAPTEIQFTDISSPVPDTWQWTVTGPENFNTGVQNPGFTFIIPGVYTVCLSVNNNPTPVFCQDFTIFAPPGVNFGIAPGSVTTGCAPLTVCFENLTTPGSCPIDSVIWDLGIPPRVNTNDPCVTFPEKDQIQVTLIVVDECGCWGEFNSIENYIEIYDPPEPTFTVSPASGCDLPLDVTVSNTSFMQAGTEFTWDFPGDGVSPQEFSGYDPGVVTYSAGGEFDITLTADDNGCSKDTTLTAAIVVDLLVADFIISDATPCVDQIVQFTNTSNIQSLNCIWLIDNVSVSMDCTFSTTFPNPGPYNVTLITTTVDGFCSDTISQVVNVRESPDVDFTADATEACTVPFTVNFSADSQDALTYDWTISPQGSGSFDNSNISDPQATFTSTGSYDIGLTVTGSSGCSAEIIKEDYIIIDENAIEADIVTNVQGNSGCAPLDACFELDIILPAEATIASVTWNTSGGIPSSGSDPGHCLTYSSAGEFIIVADITFTGGCAPVSITDTIRVSEVPALTANINPTDVCLNECVNGVATSDLPGTEFSWYFEAPGGYVEGGVGTVTNVGYCYTDEFQVPFTVWLVGNNNSCRDTVEVEVTVNPPAAVFEWEVSCFPPTEVVFNVNESSGVFTDEGSWYIDDVEVMTFADISDADFTYDLGSTGEYDVLLVVSSSFTGCTDSNRATIILDQESIDWTYSPDSGEAPLDVAFTLDNLLVGDTVVVYFGNGDSAVVTAANNTFTFTYEETGTYMPEAILNLVDCDPITLTGSPVSVYRISGIQDYSTNVFNLYPNPVSLLEKIHWQVDGIQDVRRIRILDMTGRVLEDRFEPQENSISLKGLSQGVYLFLMDAGDDTAGKLFEVID